MPHRKAMKPLPSLSRRGFLAAAGSLLVAPAAIAGAAARPVIVELFTSQGCSSCAKADALFAELCADRNLLALSFHIDYWDYLGWKDTLASPEHSQRQYDYARARGDMNVYTPQMVIDGRIAVVGSDRAEVDKAIATAAAAPTYVPLALTETTDELTIEAGAAAGEMGDGMFWLLPIVPRVLTKIMKGENSGMEIEYRNIVRAIIPAGMWRGEAKSVSLPKSAVLQPDCKGCIALLQQDKVGQVLGAAAWGETSA
ncbi:MAG: DUF1223 domain-containing protein [Alphaproteobacteria bacterium]|nr:DUF1223 domain-containing protein [Alphaproteobacteria bacterium]